MGTMTNELIEALYQNGKAVYEGKTDLNTATSSILAQYSENIAETSARFYIDLYSNFISGKGSTWNQNSSLVLYYVEHITLEQGLESGANAFKAGMNFAKEKSKKQLISDLNELWKRIGNGSPEKRNTWLLTWNPNNWKWDGCADAVSATQSGKRYIEKWSCSSNHVQKNDRIFLIKLGGQTNGIIASGYAEGPSYETEHWDEQKRLAGVTCRSIDVSFDAVLNPEGKILSQEQLKEKFPEQHWSPQASGIAIKPEYCDDLEKLWSEFCKKSKGLNEVLNIKDSISKISKYITSRGFTYPKGLIENFYLSLKSKPFVILAGISGTGKTRLVKLFAEAIGAEFKLVSVRPDWSDGSDLFGHTDLYGNFVPGPICSAFDSALEYPDKPVFLCLDEMNLARVEYYLSDFLSVIESRENRDGKIVTESIAHYKDGIPDNLYIIGTVNMDETTFPFSKKVLDRANTIEFSKVNLKPLQPMKTVEPQLLPNSFLQANYLVLATDCMNEEPDFVEKICDDLQALNVYLEKANSHVGYRVRDEIVFYMLYNKKSDDLLKYEEALDNEIMQKILPRIQGSSAAIKKLLFDLFKFCMGNDAGIDADTGNAGEQMKSLANTAKYPASAEKIGYMMTRFEDDGFTSYWL